ncbi:50S ribosomal protein L22, chloroplastic [Capsicum chinense]|nr:50S ribosomal protein L22, chloroplastic [Capsicum chinense]
MSADKARRVIDQIRGCSYEEALMILELLLYRACYPILKLVYSVVANASYNTSSSETNLVISKTEVNGGTTGEIIPPPLAPGAKFNITSTMIQLLNLKGLFGGLPGDDPNLYLVTFVTICKSFNNPKVGQNAIQLRYAKYDDLTELGLAYQGVCGSKPHPFCCHALLKYLACAFPGIADHCSQVGSDCTDLGIMNFLHSVQAGRVEMPFHLHRSKLHDSLINDPVQSPRPVFGPTNGLFHKNTNPGTYVSVMLVSEAGVEVIVNVVVKGLMSLDGLTFRVSDFHEHQI